MSTLPSQRPVDQRMVERVAELERDGYIVFHQGWWRLTHKGWSALSSAAEPKIKKPTRRLV